MPKKFLKFEVGMTGTGLSTHNWTLDCATHNDNDIRALVRVLVAGLFQTEEEKELSSRYLKIIGDVGSIQWTSRKVQEINPDIDNFEIPRPFIES